MTTSEFEQASVRLGRVVQPLLNSQSSSMKRRRIAEQALTFTLLSPLELIKSAWPGTNSNPVTLCSCASRFTCSSLPPLLRSQVAIDPFEAPVASIGCPSAKLSNNQGRGFMSVTYRI